MMGIDQFKGGKSAISKFIIVNLPSETSTAHRQAVVEEVFPSNESCLTHFDADLRLEEAKGFVVEEMQEVTDHKSTAAWRRVAATLMGTASAHQTRSREEIRERLEN